MREKMPKGLDQRDVHHFQYFLEQATDAGAVRYLTAHLPKAETLRTHLARFQKYLIRIDKYSDGFGLRVEMYKSRRVIADTVAGVNWTELEQLWNYFVRRVTQKKSDDYRSREFVEFVKRWDKE